MPAAFVSIDYFQVLLRHGAAQALVHGLFTARRMFSYPVQRHRWPERSFRSSSSVYSFPLSRDLHRRQDKARGAEAALDGRLVHKGLLDVAELAVGAQQASRVRMCFPSAHTAR